MEILSVVINDGLYGINVAKVQSILQYDPKLVTAIPDAPSCIKGMLLYRDRTIPLIDLAVALGMPQPESLQYAIVVVTEFNKSINGFLVIGVQRIHRLSWDEFIPLNSIFGSEVCINGSVNVDDKEILVIDLEQILASLFPKLTLEEIETSTFKGDTTLSRANLNIIFAEDSKTIRKGLVAALRKAGFESVLEFDNGQLALDYLNGQARTQIEQGAHFALISDIEMPRMDGLTLCRRIKSDNVLSQMPVVMFSSLINEQMIDKCRSVGAERYVTKPETNALISYLDEFAGLK